VVQARFEAFLVGAARRINARPNVTVLPQLAQRHRQGFVGYPRWRFWIATARQSKGLPAMKHRIAPSFRGSLITSISTAALVLGATVAFAQQPPPAAPKPAAPAAKPAAPAAKPAAPAAAAPAPAAPQAPAAQAGAPPQADLPPLVYSPWAKICSTPGQNGQDANTPKVCFTARDARTETGAPVVAAALIEPDGVPKKIFRVTVPSPVQLQYGTRIIVDSNEPNSGQFFTCFAAGCMSDYDATPELLAKLKKGQTLNVQAINLAGTQISFPVPLAEFAKINEGPPMDPKKYEETQRKLQEDLEKKANELREKLKQQQSQGQTK
jgi:invasion protein IalB